MGILLKNARILFWNKNEWTVQNNMSLLTEGHLIKEIGTTEELEEKEAAAERIIDCKENLLMPGFKDAHTHSAMTFLRSRADDKPLQSWLNEVVFPAEAKLSPEDIYHLTKLAALEYIEGGITGVFEMYLTPDSIGPAFAEMGMRCTMTGGLNDFSQSVAKIEEWDRKWNRDDPLIRFVPGFHGEYTCSRHLLMDLAEYTKEMKRPVFSHVSETRAEVESCLGRYDMTPPMFFESLGLYDHGGGGYHCVYFSPKDFEVFQRHGLYAVLNPASNLKLASGIAPISSFINRKIPVAIGTDGPASNNCLDMFREMFLVTGLAKVDDMDPVSAPAEEILKMACIDGAFAMQTPECAGIAVGNEADLILLDLHKPNMQPISDLKKNVVYAGNKSNVSMTMIAGKVLYENGEFRLKEDVDDIYKKAEEITARIFQG